MWSWHAFCFWNLLSIDFMYEFDQYLYLYLNRIRFEKLNFLFICSFPVRTLEKNSFLWFIISNILWHIWIARVQLWLLAGPELLLPELVQTLPWAASVIQCCEQMMYVNLHFFHYYILPRHFFFWHFPLEKCCSLCLL